MNLPIGQIDAITMAATIHDVGKIYVPAEILNRPGRLSNVEFSLIQMYPEVGYEILKPIEFEYPVSQIVLQHHERMNGSGYPKKLSGDEILLEASIIAVADVFEAIIRIVLTGPVWDRKPLWRKWKRTAGYSTTRK